MKKNGYILFSALLSFIIVYMGVGIPVIQYQCTKCAYADQPFALLTIVETSTNGCSCGCADKDDSCNIKNNCSCGDQTKDYTISDNAKSNKQDPSCSNVKIEKLYLPTLMHSFHLDDINLYVVDLIYFSYINLDLSFSTLEESMYADTSLHRQPPRGYLNFICTLLI